VYALADSLAACVNTTGSGPCTSLFGYTKTNGVTPTDTIGAAINIARNPGTNVSNILALGGSTPPFATTFTSANDLTLAVTYSGGGISSPSAVAVDASGNLWIANSATSSVTELSHTGVAASGSPYTAGGITAPSAIAIDGSGNAWIANYTTSTITELSSAGANVGSSPFSGGGLNEPSSISFDGLGNLWVSNYGNSSASEFSSAGTALSPTGGYTSSGVSAPIGVAANAH
jgi:streptogramin lyase